MIRAAFNEMLSENATTVSQTRTLYPLSSMVSGTERRDVSLPESPVLIKDDVQTKDAIGDGVRDDAIP